MGSSDRVMIIKIVALVILFIAFVVGTEAHDSMFHGYYGSKESYMELTFVIITGILVFLSILMILVELVGAGESKLTKKYGIYCIIAGVLIIIAGALMLVSAILLDKASDDDLFGSGYKSEMRKGSKFYNKLAAGVLAIIAGILYFILFCMIR